jgi:hypothetical protein
MNAAALSRLRTPSIRATSSIEALLANAVAPAQAAMEPPLDLSSGRIA